MRRSANEYFWATAELLPCVPDDPFSQAEISRRIKAFTTSIRWREAARILPIIGALFVCQTAYGVLGVDDIVYDPQGWAQEAAHWIQDKTDRFMQEHERTAEFMKQMFVAYKSYKMMNNIAQRVRYGNVNFLVQFAMPKLDFYSGEGSDRYYTDGNGNTVRLGDHTQISFVPTPSQSMDDLQWLMNNGGAKIQQDLQSVKQKTSSFASQLGNTIKNALANPEGDVTTTTLSTDDKGNTVVNMESPEVWVQLAKADATAAWIFSQNRVGMDPSLYDSSASINLMIDRKQKSQNAALQAAYNRVLQLQEIAAASGENLYENSAYQDALKHYYDLATQANNNQNQSGVTINSGAMQMNNIENRVKALQEQSAGATMSLYSAMNRSDALEKNLQEIGRNYKTDQLQGMSLEEFMTQDPAQGMHEIMGLLIKSQATNQAMNQNLSELVKLMAADQLKKSKQDIEAEAAKKSSLVDGSMTSPEESSEQADQDFQNIQSSNAAKAFADIAAVPKFSPVPDPANPTGAPIATVASTQLATAQQRADAIKKADAAYGDAQSAATKVTIKQFQDDLAKQMTALKGSGGVLSNVFFAFIGAFRTLLGQTFNLEQESQAWQEAGDRMSVITTDAFDYSDSSTEAAASPVLVPPGGPTK